MSTVSPDLTISHANGLRSVIIGQVIVSPDTYPNPERKRPEAVLNGPYIEVLDPEGTLHTYIMPRVVPNRPKKNMPDANFFAILEVVADGDSSRTRLVREVDMGELYRQEMKKKGIDVDEVPNFEDVRREAQNDQAAREQDMVLPERTLEKLGRAIRIGESLECGTTAVGKDAIPHVGRFRLMPVARADGTIDFVINDIEVTDATGKNALPLGKDLFIYRPEWTRATEYNEPSKRIVNGDTFSYLRKVDGKWVRCEEERDSVLPQQLIGKDGRYGLVGGDPIWDPITNSYIFIMHEFQNIKQTMRRRLRRDLLQYAYIRVGAERRDDGTWEFKRIGRHPIVVYDQLKAASPIRELRRREKQVMYGVDTRIIKIGGEVVIKIPTTRGDVDISEVFVLKTDLLNPDPSGWIELDRGAIKAA